jgi:hypothetical protein
VAPRWGKATHDLVVTGSAGSVEPLQRIIGRLPVDFPVAPAAARTRPKKK